MYDLYAGEVGVDEYRNGVRKRIDTGWLVRRLEEACEKSSIRRAGIKKQISHPFSFANHDQ